MAQSFFLPSIWFVWLLHSLLQALLLNLFCVVDFAILTEIFLLSLISIVIKAFMSYVLFFILPWAHFPYYLHQNYRKTYTYVLNKECNKFSSATREEFFKYLFIILYMYVWETTCAVARWHWLPLATTHT